MQQTDVVLLEQFPVKWPLLRKKMCAADKVVVALFLSLLTFVPFQKFYFGVADEYTISICLMHYFVSYKFFRHLGECVWKAEKVELAEIVDTQRVKWYTGSR